MQEVNAIKAQRGSFWLLWVVASTVAGVGVALVARAAAYAAGYAVGGGTVLGEAALGAVALGGFMGAIGLAEWLVIMRQERWAGRWLLGNVVGGALGGSVMLSLMAALGPVAGALGGAIVSIVLGLSVFGGTLWLMLRGHLSWALRMAWAGVAGLVGAAMLGGGMIGALIGTEWGAGAGFGAIYGAITGGALVYFGSREAAPEPPQHEA